jgi:CoA-transferase family III
MDLSGSDTRTLGVYGPGTFTDTKFTPMPKECQRLLFELAAKTPGFTTDEELLNGVSFIGGDLPPHPGPIKTAAMTTTLHAMLGIIGHEILELRGVKTNKKTSINTDVGSMFDGTTVLVWVDGKDGPDAMKAPGLTDFTQGALDGYIILRTTAIFPTKNPHEWYQIHGSMDPWTQLKVLGINPHDYEGLSGDEAWGVIKNETVKYSARELDMMNLEHGLPGSPVYTPEQWLKTKMGSSLARHSLVNYSMVPLSENTKGPSFSKMPDGDTRPLAGVKVLELARIIAGPAGGAVLASMGAEVIRVQTDKLDDYTVSWCRRLLIASTDSSNSLHNSHLWPASLRTTWISTSPRTMRNFVSYSKMPTLSSKDIDCALLNGTVSDWIPRSKLLRSEARGLFIWTRIAMVSTDTSRKDRVGNKSQTQPPAMST